jgi:hypothetical protein
VVETSNGSFPWTQVSQRGLAYKAEDDTFYVGGWNTRTLFQVKGASYPDKGTVINRCNPPDGAISGLAYNSAADIVWEATNSPSDTIYQLNPRTCAVLGTLPHPAPGFNGAGLHMEESGNLWVVGQNNSGKPNKVYLIESGVPAFNKIPWLNETPTSGTLAGGASQAIQIVLNTTGLQPGVYGGSLFILVKAGRQSQFRIPISLIVPAYMQGASVNGPAYTDKAGDAWAADQAWDVDGWGYLNEGTPLSTTAPIARTDDPALYQNARETPIAYRFEGLAPGTYQVELRFAEIDETVGLNERLFDVMLNRQQVLTAYDIVLEGGTLTAVNESFFLPVTAGRLDVRFLPRFDTNRDPLINAIRVTHRPDR